MSAHDEDSAAPRQWETEGVKHLDLRQVMTAGELPYLHVMDALTVKPPQQTFCFHCLYVPSSIAGQLREMGYDVHSERSGPDHWLLQVR